MKLQRLRAAQASPQVRIHTAREENIYDAVAAG
jgi:hypothetical protein